MPPSSSARMSALLRIRGCPAPAAPVAGRGRGRGRGRPHRPAMATRTRDGYYCPRRRQGLRAPPQETGANARSLPGDRHPSGPGWRLPPAIAAATRHGYSNPSGPHQPVRAASTRNGDTELRWLREYLAPSRETGAGAGSCPVSARARSPRLLPTAELRLSSAQAVDNAREGGCGRVTVAE